MADIAKTERMKGVVPAKGDTAPSGKRGTEHTEPSSHS